MTKIECHMHPASFSRKVVSSHQLASQKKQDEEADDDEEKAVKTPGGQFSSFFLRPLTFSLLRPPSLHILDSYPVHKIKKVKRFLFETLIPVTHPSTLFLSLFPFYGWILTMIIIFPFCC